MSRPQTGYTEPLDWWCRISALLINKVQPAVQKFLDIVIKPDSLKTILDRNRNKIYDCRHGKDPPQRLSDEQYRKLISDCPISSDFDLTLLNFVFKHIIQKNYELYRLDNDFDDIMKIRNKLFHWVQNFNDAESLDKLKAVWDKLVQIMQSGRLPSEIFISQQDIQEYENNTYANDFEDFKNAIQNMMHNKIELVLQDVKSTLIEHDNHLKEIKSHMFTKDLNKSLTLTDGLRYEVLSASSVRVFWDRVPGAVRYKVLCIQKGHTTDEIEVKNQSCDLFKLTDGDYNVKVLAIRNIDGESIYDEAPLEVLLQRKELLKSTRTTWSTNSGPSDWIELQKNGLTNTDYQSFMGDIQGYIPVRLVPLVGIYLKSDNPVDRAQVNTWLQSGMRFFYLSTFSTVMKTDLLSFLSDFVKENSTEGVIVMYNRTFTSQDAMPSSVQLPDNVVWEFDYSKLKLSDIRSKVVMLDTKCHEWFENNRNIFDTCNHSETPDIKYWELDFKHLKAHKLFIKEMKTASIDKVSVESITLHDFVLQNGETLDSCHTHEAPMMVTCIGSDADMKLFMDTIENETSFVTCGAVAFPVSCEYPVSKLILYFRRWKNMVKLLVDSIEKQFKISVSEKEFKSAIVRDFKQGHSPHKTALNNCYIYLCQIIKDEINHESNPVRFHDFLQKLHKLSVINIEHRDLLNAAISDNKPFEDKLLAIIHKEMHEKEPKLVDSYLDQFLTVLMMNHNTRPVAYFVKEMVEKAVTYSYYDKGTDAFIPPPFVQRHRVVVTLQSVTKTVDSVTELKTKPEVMRDPDEFENKVVGVPIENPDAEYGCIHISFDVADDWDLQAVKTSVEYGIFLRRYCQWVTEKGFVYAGDEPVHITFCVDGEVIFLHKQTTPTMKSDLSGSDVSIGTALKETREMPDVVDMWNEDTASDHSCITGVHSKEKHILVCQAEDCGKKFLFAEELESHLSWSHDNDDLTQTECGKFHLNEHMQVYRQKRRYENELQQEITSDCEQATTSSTNYTSPAKISSPTKSTLQTITSTSLASSLSMKRIKLQHPEQETTPLETESNAIAFYTTTVTMDAETTTLECNICGNNFKEKSELTEHVEVQHSQFKCNEYEAVDIINSTRTSKPMGQTYTVQHVKLKPPVTNKELLLLNLKTGVNSTANSEANQIDSSSNECILNSLIENIDLQIDDDDDDDDDNENLQHDTLRQIGRMESDNNDDDFTIEVSAVLDQHQPSPFGPGSEQMEINNIEINAMAVDIIQEHLLHQIKEGELVESRYCGGRENGNVDEVFERVENHQAGVNSQIYENDEYALKAQNHEKGLNLDQYRQNLAMSTDESVSTSADECCLSALIVNKGKAAAGKVFDDDVKKNLSTDLNMQDAENLLARGSIPFEGVNLVIHSVPKEHIFKDTSPLSKTQINILVAHKFAQMEQGVGIDVTIDVDRCTITFTSKNMEALTKKKDDMNEFLRSIKSQTFHLPKSTCSLLKQEKTTNILDKEWRKSNLIIVIEHELIRHGRTAKETTATIELHARTEQEISSGVDILNNTVLGETVNVPASCQAVMKSNIWKEICDDLLHKCEGEVLIRVSEDLSSIHVTGIRHIMASVLATINIFLEQKKVNPKINIPLFHRGDATSWEWTEAEKRLLKETSDMRVLYIGEAMAGKSSLVRTILSDGSSLSDKDDHTIIAEMNHWVPDQKKKNTFSLVDLGGHESYFSSGHFFHCNAKNNVATLCHDIRSNKFSKSLKWLKAVLTRSPICHIVLALTKCDTLSEREKTEALETFKFVITRYLQKEIHTLETTIFMASEKYSDKLPTFMQLRNHYQWLVDNLNDITFFVSCKEGYEATVLKVKEHYITLSEMPENKVFMPVHYHSFFCVSGNSDMRIVQEREETYKVMDRGCKTSPAETTQYDTAKLESKSKTDVPGETPRKAKADVELNKSKQPKRINRFLTLLEAMQQFDKILEEHQLPKDDLSVQMKRCLESLHQHSLMLYFACEELENIVFNNLNTFISIMKAIFVHDIQHFLAFNKLPATYRVQFYNNEESSFKEDMDLLLTQGLLSAHLLTILLNKSECEIAAKAVMMLFDVLEIGFSFIPDNFETVYTFIPFFLENKNPSDEICDEIDRMAKCEEDFLSLHCQVRGNITVTLWHYLLVQFCKTLHNSVQRKVIWNGGFLASVGQTKINILMLFNGEDKIDLIIKGRLTSTRSHDLLWHYIGIFNDEIGSLTTNWWPGLITETLLFCTHCKIRGCVNAHEWPLHAILRCKQETCRCPSELCDMASGLIAPLPIDVKEAEKRLSQVKVHLSKTFQLGITEKATQGNTLDLNKAVGNHIQDLHSADGDFKLSEEKALHLLQNFTPLVCQIEVPESKSSGFVVGTVTENNIQHHYILTVYHGKLYEALRDSQNRYQCKAKFGPITVRITPPALYWNKELDYVMAQLEPSAMLDNYLSGKVPLGQHVTNSEPKHNDVIQISGFEANKVIDYGVKCVSINHNRVVSIHGDIRRINDLRKHSYSNRKYPLSRKFLFYDCSVRHGTPGGPCMSIADNQVYAIHCGAIYQHACDLEYGILIRYVVEDIIRQIRDPSPLAAPALQLGPGQYIARHLQRREVDNMFLHTPQTMH